MTQPTKYPLWDTNQTATSDPGSSRESDGWQAPAGVPEKPPYQTFNHWMNNVYQWIAYTNEQGVAEWDTTITYAIGAYVVATDNKLYRALVSQSGNTPVGDAVNWQPVGDLLNVLNSTDVTRGLTAAQGKVLKDVQDTLVAGTTPQATETATGFSFLPKRIITSIGTDTDHDINTTAGNFKFADGTGSANIGAFTKEIDSTWAQGSAAGGMNDGETVAADTWYHYFALSNADGSVVDFGFDSSITAAGLIADTAVIAALGASAKYSRVASYLTDGSANLIPYFQIGTTFFWKDPIKDVDDATPGTSANLAAMSTPLGVETLGRFTMYAIDPSNPTIYVSSPDATDNVPGANFTTYQIVAGTVARSVPHFEVKTDTSSQIRYRSSDGTLTSLKIFTLGWDDLNLEI